MTDTPNYYRTNDKNGVRTDYAIVQRFMVEDTVVVYVAGNTSLGTLAGIQWVALRRNHLVAPDGVPIPCPEKIRGDSTVEALLQVSAPLDDRVWTPFDLKLLKLHAAGFRWSSSTGKWHPLITIDCIDGDPRQPVAVFFGEEKETMDAKRQSFRLLVQICMLARAGSGRTRRSRQTGERPMDLVR